MIRKTMDQHSSESVEEWITRVTNRRPDCAIWIDVFNLIVIVLSLLLAPFTAFTSLFFLLLVPFDAALASIAASNFQQRNLLKLHLCLVHCDKVDVNNDTSNSKSTTSSFKEILDAFD